MAAPTKKRAVDEEIADVSGEDSSDYEDEQGMNDGEEGEQEEDMEGQVGTPVVAVYSRNHRCGRCPQPRPGPRGNHSNLKKVETNHSRVNM